MQNGYVAPIDHGAASAAATIGVESGKGGLKGMVKGLFSGTILGGVVGAGIGGIATLLGGLGAVTSWAAAGTLATAVLGSVGTGLAVGALVGTVAMFIPPVGFAMVGIATALGLYKGAGRGSDQVAQERAAAAQMNAEIAVMKAQAAAQSQGQTYAPRTNTRLDVSADMNAAPSKIQAGNDNVQYDGRVEGAQLAAAR